MAFDFAGKGASDGPGEGRLDLDVLAAVRAMRADGTSKIIAIGASKGATGVIAAAAVDASGIDGLVSLSAPESSESTDAVAVVASLEVPALFVAAKLDRSFDEHAKLMHDTCACRSRELLIVDGSSHGVRMLTGSTEVEVQAAIDRLLTNVGV